MSDDDFDAALETVVARTKVERYRFLCSEEYPDHRAWRRWVVEQATGEAPTPQAYPSLFTQAKNLAGSAGRFVASGFAMVDQAEFDRRRGICEVCPNLDRERDRCRVCSCYLAVKPWGKAERCPEGRWEAKTDGDD
jgi:hypothetical protein